MPSYNPETCGNTFCWCPLCFVCSQVIRGRRRLWKLRPLYGSPWGSLWVWTRAWITLTWHYLLSMPNVIWTIWTAFENVMQCQAKAQFLGLAMVQHVDVTFCGCYAHHIVLMRHLWISHYYFDMISYFKCYMWLARQHPAVQYGIGQICTRNNMPWPTLISEGRGNPCM